MILKYLFIIYLLIKRHFDELFSLSETESISVPIAIIKAKKEQRNKKEAKKKKRRERNRRKERFGRN